MLPTLHFMLIFWYLVKPSIAVSCADYITCSDCISDSKTPNGCGWCHGSCVDKLSTCVADADLGQFATSQDDCNCLKATSCDDNINFYGYGWCPSYNNGVGKCYQGGSDGPNDNIPCIASAVYGQWTKGSDGCNCLAATSCDDTEYPINYYGYGWCPSYNNGDGKCYQGDATAPFDNIPCIPSAEYGQWTKGSDDCHCVEATGCNDVDHPINYYGHGWCSSYNNGQGKCYQGGGDGPNDDIPCKPSAEYGQWVKSSGACSCLTATTCEEVDFNGQGWCPSYNNGIGKCFQGGSDGPNDNITCEASIEYGEWSHGTSDCECLVSTSCDDINYNGHGWCPSYNNGEGKCYQGGSGGPYNPSIPCEPSIVFGQWTHGTSDCNCLTATSCDNIDYNGHGWCPSYNYGQGKCYKGGSGGPYDSSIPCEPSVIYGQWTHGTSDCNCLKATSCKDNIDFNGHAWCPYHGKCYQGGSGGPYDAEILCPATAEKGQWSRSLDDCTCLSASNCNEVPFSYGGWCASNKRCYLGGSLGPYDGIECYAWIHGSSGCDNQECPKNCLECDTSITCTSCKAGYSGPVCEHWTVFCYACSKSAKTIFEEVQNVIGKATKAEECIDAPSLAFEGCSGLFFETLALDPVICSVVAATSYTFCDSLTEAPAKLLCETIGLCDSGSSRRLLTEIDTPQYPYWPSIYWMEGKQYKQFLNGTTQSGSILHFKMAYSYVENLVYSNLSSSKASAIYVLKNFTNYHMTRFHMDQNNVTCNYSIGAAELSEKNYLQTHLSNLGVEVLTFDQSLSLLQNISVWRGSICSNLNGTCGIKFYYYDMNATNGDGVVYRKPWMYRMVLNNSEIITQFDSFSNYIPDMTVFDEIPNFCVPTSMPTAIPTAQNKNVETTWKTSDSLIASTNSHASSNNDTKNGSTNAGIIIVIIVILVIILLIVFYVLNRKYKWVGSKANNVDDMKYQPLLDSSNDKQL